MIDLTLTEAQLYKMLVNFFGSERIVPQMSVMAVCGGKLPANLNTIELPTNGESLERWARANRCLFTIVDPNDTPKLVIDFEAMENSTIDPQRLEYQRIAEPLLMASGVRFFTITSEEFQEMLKPAGNLDLFHYFKGRFEELGFSISSK